MQLEPEETTMVVTLDIMVTTTKAYAKKAKEVGYSHKGDEGAPTCDVI